MGEESLPPIRKLHRLSAEVYAATGHEFHFTICARHQGMPFHNLELARAVIDSLLWTRDRYRWALFCYCLMPDHLHFVCRLTDANVRLLNAGARGTLPEGVLDHIARFKSYTTRAGWKYGLRGPLWQKSSYDRIVDMPRPFEEIAQYVLDNPVRKVWVGRWDEWPHSRIVDRWN